MDLSSMVMLKDNHIASAGSITKAISMAKQVSSAWNKIDVECKNFDQAVEALKAGSDIIMLDNFKPGLAKETSKKLKEMFPHSIIEISGGITEDNIQEYFSSHIDVISMSSLITNAIPVDLSLKITK